MDVVYKKARAKLNLTLNVLNKRADGYHNIESVFQKISLYDEIYISKSSEQDGINISSNIDSILGKNNIIFKAYEELKFIFPNISGVDVNLRKNIPMQARAWRGKCRLCKFYFGNE